MPAAALVVVSRVRDPRLRTPPDEPGGRRLHRYPDSAEIASIPTAGLHGAPRGEVFHVFEAGDAGGLSVGRRVGGADLPGLRSRRSRHTRARRVETRTDIDYIYLVPTSDRWADGDRRVTCFIRSLDGAPLLLRAKVELNWAVRRPFA